MAKVRQLGYYPRWNYPAEKVLRRSLDDQRLAQNFHPCEEEELAILQNRGLKMESDYIVPSFGDSTYGIHEWLNFKYQKGVKDLLKTGCA